MSHVTDINVRVGSNAVQQRAFLAVPRQRRWVNSGRAGSSGAEAEGGLPDGLGAHRHKRCNLRYFSRAGASQRWV